MATDIHSGVLSTSIISFFSSANHNDQLEYIPDQSVFSFFCRPQSVAARNIIFCLPAGSCKCTPDKRAMLSSQSARLVPLKSRLQQISSRPSCATPKNIGLCQSQRNTFQKPPFGTQTCICSPVKCPMASEPYLSSLSQALAGMAKAGPKFNALNNVSRYYVQGFRSTTNGRQKMPFQSPLNQQTASKFEPFVSIAARQQI